LAWRKRGNGSAGYKPVYLEEDGMDIFTGVTGIVAIAALFIVLPKTILSFISKNVRHKREIDLEKMRYQKEILELEVKKQDSQIKLLEEENKKLDKIISGVVQ
jgi:cell shape-determining protein MreC